MGVFSNNKRELGLNGVEVSATSVPSVNTCVLDPLGQAMTRREDIRALTGRGQYVGDMDPVGCLHATFLRSPVARGRIKDLDFQAASDVPGVLAIFTAADFDDDQLSLPVNPVIEGEVAPRAPLLAEGDVRALGQPIALVVAETIEAAQDALDMITLDIDHETPVLDLETAESEPPVDPSRSDNCAGAIQWSSGDVEGSFATAHRIVTVTVRHPRVAPSPMEGRTTLATWDDGQLTLWSGQQAPHRAQAHLAEMLNLSAERIRVIAPDVGGAFGMKASLYIEDVLIAWAACRLTSPVKWIATRSEDMLAASHGRGAVSFGRMGFDAEGIIVALEARFIFPLGYWTPFSGLVPAWNASRILPGPYRIGAVSVSSRAVATNTGPVGIYRGAGRPEAAMLLERLIDVGARALDQDPAKLRQDNLLHAVDFPWEHGGGAMLDSGNYPALLKQTLAAAEYFERRSEVERRRATGECVGLGIAFYVEPCGQGWESARATVQPCGRITIASGSSAQGQGRETATAQIASHALKIPVTEIDIVTGDTQVTPPGIGALASRSTAIGGSAILEVAEVLIDRARTVAAEALEVAVEAITQDWDGFVQHDDKGQPIGVRITWAEIAKLAPLLCAESRYTAEGEAWGCGCCVAQVLIDVETGNLKVEELIYHDDAGLVVNPALAEGQLIGGIAQGLGEALMEAVRFDEHGQLLTGSLMDYALPRASDMPLLSIGQMETRSPANKLGAKGVGEAGTIGAPPALVNAALDALAPYGVVHLDMPLSAQRVWEAIEVAKTGKRSE